MNSPTNSKMPDGDPRRCFCWDIRLPHVHTLDDHEPKLATGLFQHIDPDVEWKPSPVLTPEQQREMTMRYVVARYGSRTPVKPIDWESSISDEE